VTGAQRYRATPNVPTISEVSIPGFDVTSWFGILAPTATPQSRLTLLNLNINRVLRLPELAERLVAQGAEPEVKSPKEFGDYVQKEVERWSRVIKTAGIKNR
jgi:tripartite-type tricarboxylate transporter receptor subunit TctC